LLAEYRYCTRLCQGKGYLEKVNLGYWTSAVVLLERAQI
jgi:hypothetical protein